MKKRAVLAAWVFLSLLVLALVFYGLSLRSWANFPYRPGGQVSDFTITFWPNIHYIQRAVAEYGEYPLWRSSIFSGSPFDVDPQSGLWYLPNVIFFFLPITQGFNLLFLLHSLLAGVGLWNWSKSTGTSDQGAFIAAVAYMFAPRMMAHLGFGHVGLFYAAAYIPWIMWAARYLASGQGRYAGVVGLGLGMQMIAHIQLAVYTGALAGLYIVLQQWPQVRRMEWKAALLRLIGPLGGFPLAFAVAAVQLFPLLRFAPYSGRAQMAVAGPVASALPARYLMGLILPDHNGFADFMVYVGAPLLALSMFSLIRADSRRWWMAIGLMAAYAVGPGIGPLGALLLRVPLLNWLRAPARIWFLASAVIPLLAGWGYDYLRMVGHSASRKAKRRLLSFGIIAFIWLLLGGYWATTGLMPGNLVQFGIGASLTVGLVLLIMESRLAPSLGFLALTSILLGDLWGMDLTLIEGRSPEWVFGDQSLALELAGRIGDDLERVYSPSYSLPRQLSARYEIQTVDGVDPLYMAAYDDFMQVASGITRGYYSSVIPAMEGGAPVETANQAAMPNPSLLGLLSAKYVATEFPLQTQGLNLIGLFGSTHLYENTLSLPAAFFVRRALPVASIPEALAALTYLDVSIEALVEGGTFTVNPDFAWQVQWRARSPDRMELQVETERKALLVISQPWYLDWTATVDGKPARIYRTDAVLMGIMLDPGMHRLVMAYRPKTLAWGIFFSVSGAAICVFLIVAARPRRRRGWVGGMDPQRRQAHNARLPRQ
jgi:hypothetical protein